MKNDYLELFRLKTANLIRQHGERLKIFIAENKLMGMDAKTLKEQRGRELSCWNLNREQLNRQVKREVAGLVNKLFIAVYLQGITSGGKKV